MEYPSPPRGLIIDLITPLNERGDLDIEALERHLERIMDHVHGVLLASPWAGEGSQLLFKTRKELLQRTMGCVSSNTALLVWITGHTEEATRRNLIALQKVSEDTPYERRIYWVDTPLLYHSNRGLPSLYRELYDLGNRPFLLINDPYSVAKVRGTIKRKNIRTSILKETAKMEFISGIIFLGPLERAYNYEKAVRSRDGFRLYEGDEGRFLEYPSLSGVISAGANLAPEKWRAIIDSSLHLRETSGDYPDSLKQTWETGQYLHQLRDYYATDPPTMIKLALSELSLLPPTAGVQPNDPKATEIKKKLVDLLSKEI